MKFWMLKRGGGGRRRVCMNRNKWDLLQADLYLNFRRCLNQMLCWKKSCTFHSIMISLGWKFKGKLVLILHCNRGDIRHQMIIYTCWLHVIGGNGNIYSHTQFNGFLYWNFPLVSLQVSDMSCHCYLERNTFIW